MPKTKRAKSTQAQPKKVRVVKSHVISFRVTEQQHEALETRLAESEILHIRSIKHLARKFVSDALADRLVYKNPEHAKVEVDMTAEAKARREESEARIRRKTKG